MNRLWTKLASALTALLMGVTATMAAPDVPRLNVRAGKIKCVVFTPDRKPIAGAVVRISQKGKLVAQLKTDKKGGCTLTKLARGTYELAVGEMQPMTMVATDEAVSRELLVLMPDDDDDERRAGAWVPWVVGAGVVSVIVAVPLIRRSGDDGDTVYVPVSP